jgi:hypothetical protein
MRRGARRPAGVISAAMNLEPQKASEIRAGNGVARVMASLAILVLAALTILVVLEVIPRSAFAEVAGKTAMVAGICVISVVAIGLLTKR